MIKKLSNILFWSYGSLFLMNILLNVVLSNKPIHNLYIKDSDRGHALKPNYSEIIETTYSYPVKINSSGYRDINWSFSSSDNILFLGDSFTFGEPLPIEEGFVFKVRSLLPDRVSIYNAGVSSYGSAHALKTLEMESPKLKPKHVFYMYYFNDTRWDNVRLDATTVIDGYMVNPLHDDRIHRHTSGYG